MEIQILYIDKRLILCIKPAGVLSESPGMPELLKEQLGGEIYPIHRLDRAVGGLMLYGRTKEAAGKLSGLVSNRGLKKSYLAVVEGCPEEKEGIFKDLLFKDSAKNKSYVVKRPRKGVKDAELSYKVLKTDGKKSLVEIQLLTGRSHQIRVQFASRKIPLLGDVKYGSTYKDRPLALWSKALSFTDPFTRREMNFEVMPSNEYPWNEFIEYKENENV